MTRIRTTARIAALAVAAAAVAATGAATTASAATGTFGNPANIQINDQHGFGSNFDGITVPASGNATPYPSTIVVSGEPRTLGDVNVTLYGLTHAFPSDLDMLLVGPHGQQVVLMSDATTETDGAASGITFTLDDEASTTIPDTLVDGVAYRPTNVADGADSWPTPAPDASSAGTSLSVFDGTNANGTWSLYVEDDFPFDGGSLDGWSLDFTRAEATSPYPSTIDVSGLPRGITDVNATLTGLSHDYPDDIDAMLVGPSGQRVMLMSDAGGSNSITNVDLAFDDEAAAAVPDSSVLTTGSYRPFNYDTDDEFPAPAPDPAGAASTLSAFDGTNPNGVWKLFITDQYGSDEGELTAGWSLSFTTVDMPGAATLTSPASGSTDDDGIVTFGGSAPAGATVQILDGATVVATTTAAGTGSYTVSLAGVANGDHSYTARTADAFGNVSAASAAVTVTVDSVAPAGTVSINRGAARTNQAAVTLTLAATDAAPSSGVTQMRFSNDGTTFSAFQAYATSKAWTLTNVNGTKTVWVQFADRAGKVSGSIADSIVLDTVRPKVVLTNPVKKATGVKVGKNVTAKLSEAIAAGTVTKANVKLVKAGTTKAIRAVITYNATKHKIKINPKGDLAHGTTYKVTIRTGIKDLAGNNLDQKARAGLQPKTWRFTTG
jgi:subtilisin-like proprotein convertase family protein